MDIIYAFESYNGLEQSNDVLKNCRNIGRYDALNRILKSLVQEYQVYAQKTNFIWSVNDFIRSWQVSPDKYSQCKTDYERAFLAGVEDVIFYLKTFPLEKVKQLIAYKFHPLPNNYIGCDKLHQIKYASQYKEGAKEALLFAEKNRDAEIIQYGRDFCKDWNWRNIDKRNTCMWSDKEGNVEYMNAFNEVFNLLEECQGDVGELVSRIKFE